jgi:H+-transporting ATPase
MNNHVEDKELLRTSSASTLFNKLSSSPSGLLSAEATKRLEKYDYNEITEKTTNPIKKFLGYFFGPIPWMIEAALVISGIIGHWEDFFIILVLLCVNVVVGFWHEYKAENAINLLKQKLAIKTKVLRNKTWEEALARNLVPGDVIRIHLGDIVPADAKLFDTKYLLADESALTGESLPVEKKSDDLVYSGSIIHKGESNALVVATGADTFFGQTAKLVAEAKTKSHFQKALIKIGNYLIKIAIVLVIVVFAVSVLRGESVTEILQFSLVLVIAAIPVALPAVLSVTLAAGAYSLAKKQTIVSKLASVEELAGMDVLCSDKTGTLTKNQLTVGDPRPFGEFTKEDVVHYAYLASEMDNRDPIDDAIAKKSKDCESRQFASFKIKSFLPFDPVIKRSESIIDDGKGHIIKVSKGALQVILGLIHANTDVTDKALREVEDLASEGYRTIGVARADDQDKWEFVGIIPLFDPPRDDAAKTIGIAKLLGVKIKMLTGDHVSIAKQISKKLGLGSDVLPASELKDDNDLQALVEKSDGFAQIFPEHKYRIVDVLQKKNHIVGMTGDGVNDAPALKKADIGIAVSNATDAAKSAAGIVLTQPGISVIVDAIKESRDVFQRMKNYAVYRLGETIRILLFLTLSIIAFNFFPVTAIMIVLLALLNDIPIMTIAFDRVQHSKTPQRWNIKNILIASAVLGAIGVVESFLLLYIGRDVFVLPAESIQTLIYLKLSVAGHMFLFVARTRKNFWTVRPSLPLFLAVCVTQLVATIIAVYGLIIPAIGWNLALFVWGYSFLWFLVTDFGKILLYKFIRI